MSVILNDVKIWRSLLQDIPDLYEDSDVLKVILCVGFILDSFFCNLVTHF